MKNIKKDIEFLGLNYKKEMGLYWTIVLLIVLGSLGLFYFYRITYLFAIPVVLIMVFSLFYLTRYSSKRKVFTKNSEKEFVSLLSYFEVFISNHNNVYHSFELLLSFSSDYMVDIIQKFLNEVDVDKSVQPFINFAHQFNNTIFESIMLSIYQMVDNGENTDSLSQFDVLFSHISLSQKENKIAEKQSSLDSSNVLPLFGSGIITIILIISIFTIMGDMIDVI